MIRKDFERHLSLKSRTGPIDLPRSALPNRGSDSVRAEPHAWGGAKTPPERFWRSMSAPIIPIPAASDKAVTLPSQPNLFRLQSREMDDELRFHEEIETESNISRGMPRMEARRVALLDLGGVAQTKKAIRNVRAMSIEPTWRDARHALRAMRKNPAFTALVIVTVALGIGVNAASFAVAYGILVRPLPYVEPSRVVILNLLFADGGDLGFSPRVLQDWLPRLRTVEVAAGYYRREVTVRSGARSTVVSAALVTDRFFDVLGTPAEFGHTRARTDTPEAVVGRRAINQILRRSPSDSVGFLVSVSDRAHTISGVMPSDIAFPDDEIGLWLPSPVLLPGTKPEGSGYSKIVARLKPGVTLDQVRDDANRVRLELNPKSGELVSVALLGESVVGGMRRLLMVTIAGALLVLLVACANAPTLFIGRDVARQREFAARRALGATASARPLCVG